MRERIVAELASIERVEHVRILYAVESGSRAWRFPSQDSDYDVRFLYLRPMQTYLSIAPTRDVIEQPIADDLDVTGWDVQKALGLFQKSNPSILEWLHSPIVYLEQFRTATRIRDLEPIYVKLRSSMFHYINLAKGQFNRYLRGDMAPVKKCFYALRPVLACGWLLEHGTFPPLDFSALMGSQLPESGELVNAIQALLQRKRAGDERDSEARIPVIHAFLEEAIAAYEARVEAMVKEPKGADQSMLDDLFRALLKEAWELRIPGFSFIFALLI